MTRPDQEIMRNRSIIFRSQGDLDQRIEMIDSISQGVEAISLRITDLLLEETTRIRSRTATPTETLDFPEIAETEMKEIFEGETTKTVAEVLTDREVDQLYAKDE